GQAQADAHVGVVEQLADLLAQLRVAAVPKRVGGRRSPYIVLVVECFQQRRRGLTGLEADGGQRRNHFVGDHRVFGAGQERQQRLGGAVRLVAGQQTRGGAQDRRTGDVF